jgi:hypothetical protein
VITYVLTLDDARVQPPPDEGHHIVQPADLEADQFRCVRDAPTLCYGFNQNRDVRTSSVRD